VDVARKGYSVIKRISLLVTAALLVATMAMAGLAGPAFAAQCPDGERAENVGGGFKQCEEEGKNPKFNQTQTVKGSFSTPREPTETCEKDGQERDKCPPGQFR
jgi:hypothetical protein